MSDYYVEIFLGISIGAFVISILFLIPLIKENFRTKTQCKTVIAESKNQRLTKNLKY